MVVLGEEVQVVLPLLVGMVVREVMEEQGGLVVSIVLVEVAELQLLEVMEQLLEEREEMGPKT
ncbi:MAG: hypothetical protein NTZ78_05245 [Candidatus Aureabacteria bacterium]|nr:hypothetical protein [Candidatus Auribacterota bacterium]